MAKLPPNIILNVDSYKNDHGKMLPIDTQYIFSTIVPRRPNKYTNLVKVMGTQYIVKEFLTQKVEPWMIEEAEIELKEHGFKLDKARWQYIIDKHNGYLPLEIRAVPEGKIIPVGNAIMTIVNTDPKCAWLTSYVETAIQRAVWKMTTVASISYDLYNLIDDMLYKHTGLHNLGQYHLHNFGSRGADGEDSDIIAGIAHLSAGFKGTDCTPANRNIKFYYNTKKAYGINITASEHSVMCSWSNAHEEDDFKAALMMIDLLEEKIKNNDGAPIVSIVADTYDIFRFTAEYIGSRLKDRIINLGKLGGKVVIRPDSGDPKEICIKVIKTLMQCFGYSTNDRGYKVLPPYIGVIQGDGINNDSLRLILKDLDREKISLENIVFGMGGGLTHEAGRDEFSFSMKATARFDGRIWHDLIKSPITDVTKRSLKGRVTTYSNLDQTVIFSDRIERAESDKNVIDLMETIYLNGKITKEYNFDEVLARNNTHLIKGL